MKLFKCRYCNFHTQNAAVAKAHKCVQNLSASYRTSPMFTEDAWLGAYIVTSTSGFGSSDPEPAFSGGGGSFGGAGASGSWDSDSSSSSSYDSGSSDSGSSGGGD